MPFATRAEMGHLYLSERAVCAGPVYIHIPGYPTGKSRLHSVLGTARAVFKSTRNAFVKPRREEMALRQVRSGEFLTQWDNWITRRFKNPFECLMQAFELPAATRSCCLLCSAIFWSRCSRCHPGGEAKGSARQRSPRTRFHRET